MPNSHYYRARAKWATKTLDWVNDDMRMVLVSDVYVVDLAAHEFLSSIAAGSRLGTPVALTGRTVDAASGTCKAATPVVFGDVPATGVAKAVVIFKHTGSDATAPLLVHMDKAISGLPLTMTGVPVHVILPAAGLFAL